MLLQLAIQSGVPIIAITTTDTVNVEDIVSRIAKNKALTYKAAQALQKSKLYIVQNLEVMKKTDWSIEHTRLETNQCTLVVVNPPHMDKAFFNAGELPVPKEMIAELIESMVSKDKVAEIVPAVGGCTLKDVTDFIRLTSSRDKSLTAQGIMKTRKEFFSSQKGLTHVDTTLKFYHPPEDLVEYVTAEKHFFLNAEDPRLRARGLLLDGPPGTGKTEAARYIANHFGIPLFRLDIAGAKNKYVGESEQNLSNALARIDHEEPCAVLIDEVEKLFGDHGETGTSTSMLSQLLWWLQEHESRVVVIMTTNNKSLLPKELYRPGRIDTVMRFEGVPTSDARAFLKNVMLTFKGLPKGEPDEETLDTLIGHAEEMQPDEQKNTGFISQGILMQAAKTGVKLLLAE